MDTVILLKYTCSNVHIFSLLFRTLSRIQISLFPCRRKWALHLLLCTGPWIKTREMRT